MFDIEYKGGNGIVVAGKKTTAIIDPKLSVVGLKDLAVKEAVEIATEERFALNSPDAKITIEGPGEYETGELSVRGIAAVRHIDPSDAESISTIYRLEINDIRIAVLGNIAPKLTEDQLEGIGVVDVLIIPVGGNGYTLDATSAVTLTRQIDPRVVVPIHYADKSLQYEVPQDDIDTFVKELGVPVEEAGSKYKIKSSASIPQVLTVVKIDRS